MKTCHLADTDVAYTLEIMQFPGFNNDLLIPNPDDELKE